MDMLDVALDPATVIVAEDPGKVMNTVWASNGTGLLEQPVSLPVSRPGIWTVETMLAGHAGEWLFALEATGNPHRAWAPGLERLHPGRCGCLRRRRPRQPLYSWGRATSRTGRS